MRAPQQHESQDRVGDTNRRPPESGRDDVLMYWYTTAAYTFEQHESQGIVRYTSRRLPQWARLHLHGLWQQQAQAEAHDQSAA